MRKTVLFIAMSVDGYIADTQGDVAWLNGQNPEIDSMASYQEFIQTVDTIIMGWTTYHQITTELFNSEWPYKGMKTYVLTHRQCENEDEIEFINTDVCSLVERLKNSEGQQIWICGGAKIAQPLIENKSIDRYRFSIIPILLGDGIPLFKHISEHQPLKLIDSFSYNGITDLIYEQR